MRSDVVSWPTAIGNALEAAGYPRTAGFATGVLTGPLAIAGFALLPSPRRVPRGARQRVNIADQQANVEIVRRALEWDQDVLDEHMAWHFQSPFRESVLHFEGKNEYTTAWLDMRRAATGDCFRQVPTAGKDTSVQVPCDSCMLLMSAASTWASSAAGLICTSSVPASAAGAWPGGR